MSFFWLSDNAVILQADGKALKDVSTEKPASEVTSAPTDQSHADVSSVKVTIAAQQWLLWYHAIFLFDIGWKPFVCCCFDSKFTFIHYSFQFC